MTRPGAGGSPGRPRPPLAVVALAAAAACGDGGRAPALPSFEPAERRLESVPAEELWSVGGDPSDTLLLLPVDIVARDGTLYVLDRYGHRVAAFDAATGAHRWTRGRRGSGPGELESPRELAPTAAGGLAVADGGNPRIARMSTEGEPEASLLLRETGSARSICGLPGGDWLVATLDPDRRLARVGTHGTGGGAIALPGPYGPDVPPIATQVLLVGGGRDPCVLLFRLGAGFAVFGAGAFGPFRPYVEPVTPPAVEVESRGRRTVSQLTEPTAAALDAAVAADELWVLFAGLGDEAGRLLDRYELHKGRYLGTWLLPFRADAFALDDARLYVLARRAGYPVVVALPRPAGPGG